MKPLGVFIVFFILASHFSAIFELFWLFLICPSGDYLCDNLCLSSSGLTDACQAWHDHWHEPHLWQATSDKPANKPAHPAQDKYPASLTSKSPTSNCLRTMAEVIFNLIMHHRWCPLSRISLHLSLLTQLLSCSLIMCKSFSYVQFSLANSWLCLCLTTHVFRPLALSKGRKDVGHIIYFQYFWYIHISVIKLICTLHLCKVAWLLYRGLYHAQ